jgi:hypothetical protein
MPAFSDFVIYVDESGDHSLSSIDENYPLFVLAFCIFKKSDYFNLAVPALQEFKFRWFGHDLVILHENEIVKRKGVFSFLQYDNIRQRFMHELNEIITKAPMKVVAAVIRKDALKRRYTTPVNPYELALLFCMERAWEYLATQESLGTTHIIVESRSPREKRYEIGREDRELELEFRRILAGRHKLQNGDGSSAMPNFDILFAAKQVNSSGLQIADLIARPIGLNVLRPQQQNRAYQIISDKLWCGPGSGTGLKIFP